MGASTALLTSESTTLHVQCNNVVNDDARPYAKTSAFDFYFIIFLVYF